MTTDYIFGYGSLISDESRARTGESGRGFPVRVTGFRREWNHISQSSPMVAVGIVEDDASTCNGVVFSIPEGEISNFDKREIGYKRVRILLENVEFLDDSQITDGNIWVYITNNPQSPTVEHPIAQSYVDVILTGCLSISENYAREFVKTTIKWGYWVDDRSNPRYVRFMKEVPLAKTIDSILNDVIAEKLKLRKKE